MHSKQDWWELIWCDRDRQSSNLAKHYSCPRPWVRRRLVKSSPFWILILEHILPYLSNSELMSVYWGPCRNRNRRKSWIWCMRIMLWMKSALGILQGASSGWSFSSLLRICLITVSANLAYHLTLKLWHHLASSFGRAARGYGICFYLI